MMNNYIKTLSKELGDMTSLQLFWDRILKELANYGVTSISYIAIATHAEAALGARARSSICKSNHCQKYFDSFGLDELVKNCRGSEGSSASVRPIIWHEVQQSLEASLQPSQAEREGGDMGLHIGFTLPTTYYSVDHFGAISVSMAKLSQSEFEQNWPRQKDEIIQILGMLHERMREQYIASIIGLSRREKEVLMWLALGERPKQIAERLKIGSSTIDKYICSARTKLKARTRDQAVANAVIFKAIQP